MYVVFLQLSDWGNDLKIQLPRGSAVHGVENWDTVILVLGDTKKLWAQNALLLQLTKSSQLRVAFQESGRMTVPTITHLKILHHPLKDIAPTAWRLPEPYPRYTKNYAPGTQNFLSLINVLCIVLRCLLVCDMYAYLVALLCPQVGSKLH